VQGYDTVVPENSSVRLNHGSARYALCPVWLLNTTWNGQRYTFAMNGQTGKFVGDLPMDTGAFWRHFLGAFALSAAAAAVLQILFHML